MTARQRIARLLLAAVTLVAGVAAAALVPELWRLLARAEGRSLFIVVALLTALAAALAGCLLALVLLARAWQRSGARALAVFLAAGAAVWTALLRSLRFEVDGGHLVVRATADNVAASYVFLTGLMFLSAAFLNFSSRFPAPLRAETLAARGVTGRLRALLLRPAVVWCLAFAWPFIVFAVMAATVFAVLVTAPADAAVAISGLAVVPATVVTLAFPLVSILFGTQNLVAGYRGADADGRRRLQWLLVGVVVSAWITTAPLVVAPLVPLLPEGLRVAYADLLLLVGGVSPSILVVAIALAMFTTGGVDPALVLRRSTVLGILGTAWVVAFAALEAVAAEWLSATLHLPGFLASVLVAVVAAGLALPLRARARGIAAWFGERHEKPAPPA